MKLIIRTYVNKGNESIITRKRLFCGKVCMFLVIFIASLTKIFAGNSSSNGELLLTKEVLPTHSSLGFLRHKRDSAPLLVFDRKDRLGFGKTKTHDGENVQGSNENREKFGTGNVLGKRVEDATRSVPDSFSVSTTNKNAAFKKQKDQLFRIGKFAEINNSKQDGSTNNLPLITSPVTVCGGGSIATFIRVPRALAVGIPAVVSSIDVVSCSQYCRNNTEPTTGVRRFCQAFNYKDGSPPSCELFDGQTELGPLNRNAGSRAFYHEKVCLFGTNACKQRPYAFEAWPDSTLSGNVVKSVVVRDEAECLTACLTQQSFGCQSVNYIRYRRLCEMSRFSRRSKARDFSGDTQGVDYFENNCLTNSCLQKCLDSQYTFCRSVEYYRTTNECVISDEDSFSIPERVDTVLKNGIDLYEPVCLPSTGETKIVCDRPFLFEKVMNSSLNVERGFRVLNEMTAEDCMNTCARDVRCHSINYNKISKTCMLFEYGRNSRTTPLSSSVNSDYYENNCRKSHGCFFTLESVGRVLTAEYRNRELQVDSSLECKMSCIRRGESCGYISYSDQLRTCYHGQKEDRSRNSVFDLTLPNLAFNSYTKGDCIFQGRPEPDGVALSGNHLHHHTPSPNSQSGKTHQPGQPFQISKNFRPALSTAHLEVSAFCLKDGVNISVVSSYAQGYTGAVYGAERYSFCRNVVTSQSRFWLFLPRPDVNTACNTIMVDDVLSAVIVISNDNIIPYDVTTKDDLFFHVSCDYSSTVFNDGGDVIVTGGLVVGGPTPRVVAAAGVPSRFEANLRITRDGLPVENVLIGERLMLNIDSNVDSVRMMLNQCNVSRIGGPGFSPEPLTILQDGCPVVPQVVRPVERTPWGLQTPLTAFRIDGSAEIQFICLVKFCPQQCRTVICPSGDRTLHSLERKKRTVDDDFENLEEDQNIIESVNGRLRVFVEGEKGAPLSEKTLRNSNRHSAKCVHEVTFAFVTVTLGLLVTLLTVSLACMFCRRSWMVTLQHKLLMENTAKVANSSVHDSVGSLQSGGFYSVSSCDNRSSQKDNRKLNA